MTGAYARLVAAFDDLKNPAERDAFLREILTPAEIHDLTLRWRLLELLDEGMPQREIARRLRVSLCKITRGARILKSGRSVVARLIAPKL